MARHRPEVLRLGSPFACRLSLGRVVTARDLCLSLKLQVVSWRYGI